MKRWISYSVLGLLVSAASSIALAQEESFERFFTERKLRIELDRAREQYTLNHNSRTATTQSAGPQFLLPEVKLHGIVVRENGDTQIWLHNGDSVSTTELHRQSRANGQNKLTGQPVRVPLPGGGYAKLKPGQVYSLEKQTIVEGYEQRSATTLSSDTLQPEADNASTDSLLR